jgi:hypothetical protein
LPTGKENKAVVKYHGGTNDTEATNEFIKKQNMPICFVEINNNQYRTLQFTYLKSKKNTAVQNVHS